MGHGGWLCQQRLVRRRYVGSACGRARAGTKNGGPEPGPPPVFNPEAGLAAEAIFQAHAVHARLVQNGSDRAERGTCIVERELRFRHIGREAFRLGQVIRVNPVSIYDAFLKAIRRGDQVKNGPL